MHWSHNIPDGQTFRRYHRLLCVLNRGDSDSPSARGTRARPWRASLVCGVALGLSLARPVAAQSPSEQPIEEEPTQFDLLSFHRQNYFITGFTFATEVKFQFSAKYDLWPNLGQHSAYFAFTELSLWNVYRKSSPFIELNYNPELFYVYFHHPGRYVPPTGCGLLHERVGAEHESNGESAPRSRGWNRLYVESRFACYDEQHRYAMATLKVWAPPIGVGDNPRIAHYLGYGQLSLSVGFAESERLMSNVDFTLAIRKSPDTDLQHGSLTFEGRWRPRFLDYSRFTPYLFGQFFTGYGETLLSYDATNTKLRVGFGFCDSRPHTE